MRSIKRLLEFDAVIAAVLVIAAIGWMPLNDPDFFWHLKNGELIIATGELFNTDPFSHTAPGAPIQVTGWFFDVVLAFLWEHTGESGVRVLAAVFIGLTWLAVYKTCRIYIQRKQTCALLALTSIVLLAPLIAIRPNLFTHCSFAWVLFSLLKYVDTRKIFYLLWLIPLFAVWANFHYGFAAAIALIGVFYFTAILDKLIPLTSERSLDPLLKLPPIGIFVICALAVGANPFGLQVYEELILMTVRAGSSPVSEWDSPDFKPLFQKFLLVSIISYIVMVYINQKRVSWLQLVLPLAMLWSLLTAQRNQGFWAIVLPVFLAMGIIDIAQARAEKRGAGISKLSYPDIPTATSYKLNLAILAAMLVIVFARAGDITEKQESQAEVIIPASATDFMVSNIPPGKLFNRYGSGGYLIWRGYPDYPVFVDGRYAPYSEELLREALHILAGQPGSIELMKKHDVEIVLIGTKTALSEQLYYNDRFKIVYSDESNSIYVVNSQKFSALETIERSSTATDVNEL